tara:strand:+ start:14599 stop:14772 length:174 start_codon:yes stop_codon:yes gene_type:complete
MLSETTMSNAARRSQRRGGDNVDASGSRRTRHTALFTAVASDSEEGAAGDGDDAAGG